MENYMGIDVGTSGCKAVVFDRTGKQVAAAYREYDIITPHPGWAELDPNEVIGKCFDVITQAAEQVPAKSIRSLGISTQGEAFTPIDKDGVAVGNALVSSDTRAAAYAQTWSRDFGVDKLYQITGHTAHPLFSLFKLLWLRDNAPEIWSAADKFLCFEDLLLFRLGIEPQMGWPLAGRTMLFDVRKHEWSAEILDAIGPDAAKLARPLASGTVAGKVATDLAARLGLGDEVFAVTAGHDQPCAALGAGATEPGLAMYATGTVECITPVFGKAVFSNELRANNLATYDHTVGGMYITVAYSLTGGNILKWFRDEFGDPEVAQADRTGANAYELLLTAAGEEPSPLIVLPYFTPTGTPYFDTQATGAILGLRLATRRGQVIRALLEGVAFEMRLNLEILNRSGCVINELRAVGGGAKSALWSQLKADVIGKPITTLNVTEAGCLGAALLARAADADQPIAELAGKWVKPVRTVHPRQRLAGWYTERFELYRQLYPTLRGLSVGSDRAGLS
ncbi:MAG: hypothetical protein KAX78_03145 [Phycisphaerae bacterium]|nr:hypothetical protein [Phycisphaerae bacterium]